MKLLPLLALSGALLASAARTLAQPMTAPPTLPAVRPVQFRPDTFDLRQHGAIADGYTLNS